jgi:Zn ribbon nucleic-acid-binding protein
MTQKKQKAEPNYVNFCPGCNSTDVKQTLNQDSGSYFDCNNCHYRSQIFPEIDSTKLKYLKPVPLDKVIYPDAQKITKYNPILYTVTLLFGLVLTFYGLYLIYMNFVKTGNLIISIISILLGILLTLNAINQKKARKND